jgi:uncharacterized protein (DUF1684 family)
MLKATRGPLVLVMLLAACTSKPPETTSEDYAARIAADRAEKDIELKTAKDSPVLEAQRDEVLPLAYFPVDRDYAVPAALKTSAGDTVLEMATSTGGRRRMRRVGTLEFTLKGQPMKLTAFVEVGARNLDRLFVPFADLTSGTETYPGGRYIDLDRTATGIYVIDFNRAYHPYCYFNPTWDCPYPPAENRLKLPVRAGERLKHPTT